MIFFIGLFVLLCLYKIKLRPASGEKYMTDYMSVDKTMSIKGIFIIIVFFSHFNSYVTYTWGPDEIYFKYFSMIGQCMVTLFMFYSGYGVMESIKKKGKAYVKKIPLTRVGGTLFRFDIAIVLFAIMQLCLGNIYPVKQYALSLIGWDSLENSNWYIFAMVIAYIITFFAFMISGKAGKYSHYIGAGAVTIGCCAYIWILAHFRLKDAYWYDTIILYACGIWYSLLREKIEKIININIFVWLVCLGVTAVGTLYFTLHRGDSFLFRELNMVLFAAAVVLFTMRISLHNKVLYWCGKNLFGLYILQRIPMIVFREIGIRDFNIYVYFVLCATVTVVTAWLFEKYTGLLWKKISTPKKKTA